MEDQYPPHQVIPGSINPYRQAFSWAIHEGEELIVRFQSCCCVVRLLFLCRMLLLLLFFGAPKLSAMLTGSESSKRTQAYASANNVIVYHGGKCVQLLRASERDLVTCVAWCEPFAKVRSFDHCCSHSQPFAMSTCNIHSQLSRDWFFFTFESTIGILQIETISSVHTFTHVHAHNPPTHTHIRTHVACRVLSWTGDRVRTVERRRLPV